MFSRRRVWRRLSSGFWRRIAWWKFTDVPEVLAALIIRAISTHKSSYSPPWEPEISSSVPLWVGYSEIPRSIYLPYYTAQQTGRQPSLSFLIPRPAASQVVVGGDGTQIWAAVVKTGNKQHSEEKRSRTYSPHIKVEHSNEMSKNVGRGYMVGYSWAHRWDENWVSVSF
jgi:hypothetical protein